MKQVDALRDGATGGEGVRKDVNHTQAPKLAGALLLQLAGTEETVAEVVTEGHVTEGPVTEGHVTEGSYLRAAVGPGDGAHRTQPGRGSWPARATIAVLPAAPRGVPPVQRRGKVLPYRQLLDEIGHGHCQGREGGSEGGSE